MRRCGRKRANHGQPSSEWGRMLPKMASWCGSWLPGADYQAARQSGIRLCAGAKLENRSKLIHYSSLHCWTHGHTAQPPNPWDREQTALVWATLNNHSMTSACAPPDQAKYWILKIRAWVFDVRSRISNNCNEIVNVFSWYESSELPLDEYSCKIGAWYRRNTPRGTSSTRSCLSSNCCLCLVVLLSCLLFVMFVYVTLYIYIYTYTYTHICTHTHVHAYMYLFMHDWSNSLFK